VTNRLTFSENRAAHERFEKVAADRIDDAGDDLPLALDRADDGRLARSHAAATGAAALVPMPVLRLAADEGLIDFHDTHELAEIFVGEASADAMAHVPSRFVRTETHETLHLKRANPFLAGQHQVDDAEPLAKVNIRVLENGADENREPITAAGRASVASPMERAGVGLHLSITAARADDELGPAMFGEVELAGVFVREHPLEIADGHLMDRLDALFGAGHRGVSPTMGGN
jgi:hypothetical protein